jgi:hypothetical protein
VYPNFNYGTTVGRWDNPLASTFAQPIAQHLDELAQLYPVVSSWLRTGRVTYLDRSITFNVPAGQTVIQAFNVSGGFDCLVFDRKAAVTLTTPPDAGLPFTVLPNTTESFVQLIIARKDTAVDTEQSPVIANLGFGWAPNSRPQIPEFWSGAQVREFTLINNGQSDVTVVLTFTLVLL